MFFAGAFVGVSIEGHVVATRSDVNTRFYGKDMKKASEILFGGLPPPRAAAPLYQALEALFGSENFVTSW